MLVIFGTGPKYIFQELEKISNIPCKDTEELIYPWPNITECEKYSVNGRKFDWEKLYGKLESGEYVFVLQSDIYDMEEDIPIAILFTVNDKGEVSYDTPSLHGYSIG